MSSDQQTLAGNERWTPAPHEQALQGRGAQYGRTPKTQRTPADAGCCRRCETPVEEVAAANTRLVMRVLADEHGRIPACTRCTEMGSMAKAAMQVTTSERAREVSRSELVSRAWGDER